MPDKMLIDATHPEETRVVVVRGNRVEEFDFESANRKQLRGNIYLAKVTRVEPSLQAAFVDYGGNRHGFLAFSEIHPDYYQIPVADRQALIAQEERDAKAADADADNRASRGGAGGRGGRNRHRRSAADRQRDPSRSEAVAIDESAAQDIAAGEAALGGIAPVEPDMALEPLGAPDTPLPAVTEAELTAHEAALDSAQKAEHETSHEPHDATEAAGEPVSEPVAEQPPMLAAPQDAAARAEAAALVEPEGGEDHAETGDEMLAPDAQSAVPEERGEQSVLGNGNGDDHHDDNGHDEDEHVESVGGADALEEAQERAPRFRRNYKIQEVIKRRQVMLVQVVKEERGSKGAALTTYLSLAGRYSVLMPNTARGGGISRKITSGEDRSRLKEIAQELEVPDGMGVILRTAGAARTKMEVKRDFEYLLRLWETVRDLTLKSMAPKLVYEEGSLTKRSIRDLYSKDIDEIIVSGDEGYKEARDFMRMLMPSHAKNVKLYKDGTPLYTRYGIESQLDAMFQPTVQLRSGGYIVINQTEALVAIDVNSGRATREHHIEDTALKTNCEAAEEVARQLRLRDLAGLIVIDFIDMDEGRNNRSVERRMKDALKHDRARIQVGRISHFGLLEMSRQRIRTSVLESSTEKCPVCGGLGHVRSVSSVALQLLRAIEDTLNKGATHNLAVRTRSEVALYVLNHKRAHLRALEERFRIIITITADPTVSAQVSYIVDRGEQMHTPEAAKAIAAAAPPLTIPLEEDDYIEPDEEVAEEDNSEPMIAAAASVETVEDDEAEDDMPTAQISRDGERDGERDSNGGPRKRRRRGRGRGRGGEGRDGSERGPRVSAPPLNEGGDQTASHHEPHDGEADEPVEAGEAAQPRAEGAPGSAEGEDVRRRRRRGRRGGRRNRHRDGDAPAPSADGNNNGNDGFDPELQHAVAALDRPPANGNSNGYSEAPANAAPAEARPDPAPAMNQTRAQAPADETAPPRRRSTIREPAPISASGAPPAPATTLPPPTPVIVSTASEEATPKRGWWGKRLLGDKD
jgi:ribonuclease E